jgi:hypothetical protein
VNGEDEMLVISFRPRSVDFYLMLCLLEGGRHIGTGTMRGTRWEKSFPSLSKSTSTKSRAVSTCL